jgi:DnaK suppressor protein
VTELGWARAELSAERERLRRLSASLTVESSERSRPEATVVDQHEADVSAEMLERARDLSILEQVEAELRDIERALRRLEDGTYGICEACGRPIAEARLRAKPETPFCLQDRSRAEREAAAG